MTLLTTDSTRAGDFPEHWHLVYYAARVAGYNFEDSRLIADASWAADQNDDTLATGHGVSIQTWLKRISLNNELLVLPRNEDAISAAIYGDDARMLTQGVLLHSLISNTSCDGKQNEPQLNFSARSAARSLYEHYIHDVGSVFIEKPDEGTRKLRLILTGMYLHFVVDSHVHPEFAIPGHAPSGHQTDYAPNNVHGFAKAAADVYRILVNERHFLAPAHDSSLPDGTRLANRETLVRQYGLDNGLLEGVTCGDQPSSAYCFFREVVQTVSRGYTSDKLGYVNEAKANDVGPYLDELWFRTVYPHVYDNLLGPQRRDAQGTQRFVSYKVGMSSGKMMVGLPYRTLPLNQREWEIDSFISYVQEDRNDGFDGIRQALRKELICQLRSVLATVRNGTLPYLVNALPLRITDSLTSAVMNVLVGGSESSAEKIKSSSWSGQLPSSQHFTPSEIEGQTLRLTDPTRRIILEVREREWATDGLEKYLKPPGVKEQQNEKRILVNPNNPSGARDKLNDALNDALKEVVPISVIIEAPRHTPDSSSQKRVIADLIDHAGREHSKKHPGADRILYVKGAAAETLPLLRTFDPARSVGLPVFEKAIAVSPLLKSSAKLPANVSVVLERDDRFMNFDPGSPRYQGLKQRAYQFSKDRDVMIVAASQTDSTDKAAHIEYLAKGASESVILTNSPLNAVVQTVGSGHDSRQILNSIIQREGQHKPSNVGGISLVTPATVPLDASTIKGASYDTKSARVVLHLMNGESWRLPEMNVELIRNAYDCVYGQALSPELSIGSQPDNATTNPGRPGYARVYYVSALENTRLGKIMLDADQFLSVLAFGASAQLETVGAANIGVHSLPELFPSRYAGEAPGGRVYLVPSRIALQKAGSNELIFGHTQFDVRFDPSGAAENEFSSTIADRWQALLKVDQAWPFRELEEAARIVGVFNWLKEAGVAFDDSQLKDLQIGSYLTPSDVPNLTLPTPESLNRRAPFNIYGRDGLERVFDVEGKETRITYQDGQVRKVNRKDGITLDVHYDDVGNAAALVLAGSDIGAVFFRDGSGQSVNFADQVKLSFVNGKYAGFERLPQSRAIYDVDHTAVIATIVNNFIAEAHQPKPLDTADPRYRVILAASGILAVILFLIVIYRWKKRRVG